MIKDIGLVTCVYVNLETGRYWVIDYCISDAPGAGKIKLDHVQEMRGLIVHHTQMAFHTVLMNTRYAIKYLLLFVDALHKL